MKKQSSIIHFYYTNLNTTPNIAVHVHEFMTFSPHRHDFFEFEYVLSGQTQTVVNGLSYPLNKGDAVFVTPADIHSCQIPAQVKMKTITVHFSPETFPELSKLESGVFQCSSDLQAAFEQLLKESRTCDSLSDLAVKNMLERILILVNRGSKKTVPVQAPIGISAALAYIHKHFKEKITIDDVCQACGYSVSALCRYFKEQTGMTVLAYITKQRTDYAQRMLVMVEDSMEDICRACGFTSIRQFNRTFKQIYGCSPTEYKRAYRQKKPNQDT